MQKTLRIEIKIVKDTQEYTFLMPYGASHGQAYDAAFEVLKELVSMAQETAQNAERKKDVGDEHGSQ